MPPTGFDIPDEGLTDIRRERLLGDLETFLMDRRHHVVGFQGNLAIEHYRRDLAGLLGVVLNNVGDPFQDGDFPLHTKSVERAVLDYHARLWHAEHPRDATDPQGYWGYVLTMGSTEGSLYALYTARDYLAGRRPSLMPAPVRSAPDQPSRTPVVFCSEETHYSVLDAVDMLGIPTFSALGRDRYPGRCPVGRDWPPLVPCSGGHGGDGEIDLDALEPLVRFFATQGHPILLVLNFGSTFKGAHDDVGAIARRLHPVLRECGLLERRVRVSPGTVERRQGFWIHVDGALGAAHMPFLRHAVELDADLEAELGGPLPEFDFGLRVHGTDMVSSIVASGHKWLGSPWPCGVFMTRNHLRLTPPTNPDYTGSPDTTLAGSRNGLSPVVLWDCLARKSLAEHAATALRCQRLSRYLHHGMVDLERRLTREGRLPPGGLHVARGRLALAVRFRRPRDAISGKWALPRHPVATATGELRDHTHVYAMPSITEDTIDALLGELAEPGAFDNQNP